MSESTDSENHIHEIPSEFTKIVYDLINDILFTFPEYKDNLHIDLFNIKEARDTTSIKNVYEHIKHVLPERFFDILYKNEDMFNNDGINTEFLPGIHFKSLWNDDISNKTKETIWKYLQLILFTVIGKLNENDSFGDTAKLFQSINEDELKNKLTETLNNLQNMMDGDDSIIDVSGIDINKLPKPEEINDHINSLLDGKLGKLAREIAEETAGELNLDADNATSVNDVFNKIFKNPGKLMNLVTNIGGKLDSKIKSGEIKENELMEEASALMSKMKDMPGMGDIQSMMSKMGMGDIQSMMSRTNGRSRGKMPDLMLLQKSMEQNMKMAQLKERIKQRESQKSAERSQLSNLPSVTEMTNTELEEFIFSIEGDKPEKTLRNANSQHKKKKKGNKNKNK